MSKNDWFARWRRQYVKEWLICPLEATVCERMFDLPAEDVSLWKNDWFASWRWQYVKEWLICQLEVTVCQRMIDLPVGGDSMSKNDLPAEGISMSKNDWFASWRWQYVKEWLICQLKASVCERMIDLPAEGVSMWENDWFASWRRQYVREWLICQLKASVCERMIDLPAEGVSMWENDWFASWRRQYVWEWLLCQLEATRMQSREPDCPATCCCVSSSPRCWPQSSRQGPTPPRLCPWFRRPATASCWPLLTAMWPLARSPPSSKLCSSWVGTCCGHV